MANKMKVSKQHISLKAEMELVRKTEIKAMSLGLNRSEYINRLLEDSVRDVILSSADIVEIQKKIIENLKTRANIRN